MQNLQLIVRTGRQSLGLLCHRLVVPAKWNQAQDWKFRVDYVYSPHLSACHSFAAAKNSQNSQPKAYH